MPIANVALSNTFNELRTTTNDVITQVNELYALTGVTPGTYGSSSLVPIITVTNQGRVTSIVNTAIAGVTNFNYFSANSNFLINTSDGGAYATSIGQDLGTAASVSFQNLTVTGNVTFTGNTTTISANNLVVEDNIIQIGKDNITDVIDLGFLGHYNNGANVHTGLFRDATDGTWKFFQNYPIEPGANTNIDTSNASFQYANVIAHHITSNGIFYGNGSGLTTLNASNVSSGTLDADRLATSGVSAGTYGGATQVPRLVIDSKGRITSAANVNVAGVSTFNYHSGNANFQILTSAGGSLTATIGQHLGTSASVSFQDLTVTGNVLFTGNTTTINANNLIVEDNIIQIGKDNVTDVVDLGFLGHYNNGANVHTGLFRDATDSTWKFFQNYPIEPATNTNIDTSNASFQYANVTAHNITANGTFSGSGASLTTLNANNLSSGTLPGARGVTAGSTSASFITYNGTTKTSGQFYGGSTAPTNTTRLNYDGNLYATNFFGNGSNLTGISSGLTVSDDTSTNATRYLTFTDQTSGTETTAFISSTKLYFNPSTGTLNATVFNSLSDETLKKNITKITNATDLISLLDGVEFEWAENGTKSSGLIAQWIEKIVPHLVDTSENGLKTVNYSGLIAYLIEAVKELNERVKKLESK